MPGQHRQRQCTICKKWMRSDNLKGHMKTHKDLLDLSEDELEKELKVRHDVQQEKEEKRQQVVETAQNLGLSIPDEVKESKVLDKADLRSKLVNLNKVYLERVQYGEEISNILGEGEINEECLTKEHKYALDLYRQKRLRLDINEVVLRSWQKDAFDLLMIEQYTGSMMKKEIVANLGSKTMLKATLVIIGFFGVIYASNTRICVIF